MHVVVPVTYVHGVTSRCFDALDAINLIVLKCCDTHLPCNCRVSYRRGCSLAFEAWRVARSALPEARPSEAVRVAPGRSASLSINQT
jgi:hypothetical protein